MYEQLKQRFRLAFDKNAAYIFSAPGRTELGGNHTDHQLGRVLAAAVSVDTTAAVALNEGKTVVLSTAPLTPLQDEIERHDLQYAYNRGVDDGNGNTAVVYRGYDGDSMIIDNGILTVELPKIVKEETKVARQITVG